MKNYREGRCETSSLKIVKTPKNRYMQNDLTFLILHTYCRLFGRYNRGEKTIRRYSNEYRQKISEAKNKYERR